MDKHPATTDLVNAINRMLDNGAAFGFTFPLRVLPNSPIEEDEQFVCIATYRNPNGFKIRGLFAGSRFERGAFVAQLRGTVMRSWNSERPHTNSTQWLFRVTTNVWIVIEKACFGWYGNLINTSDGPGWEGNNCYYQKGKIESSYGVEIGTVNVFTNRIIKRGEQFRVSYGKGGTNTVRSECEVLVRAQELADDWFYTNVMYDMNSQGVMEISETKPNHVSTDEVIPQSQTLRSHNLSADMDNAVIDLTSVNESIQKDTCKRIPNKKTHHRKHKGNEGFLFRRPKKQATTGHRQEHASSDTIRPVDDSPLSEDHRDSDEDHDDEDHDDVAIY